MDLSDSVLLEHGTSMLTSALVNALRSLDTVISPDIQHDFATARAVSVYRNTMRDGILALLGRISIPDSQCWEDAMNYCCVVIESPQDSAQRANETWTRSCSEVVCQLERRYGPGIIAAARRGCIEFTNDHYNGDALSIGHIDKKENAMRYIHQHVAGFVFTPRSSFLATACNDHISMCCAIILSAWLPPEQAVKNAMIAHVGISDDYHAFTAEDIDTRARLVALAVGAAYELGGEAVNLLVDGTALQAAGAGDDLTMEAAMAWRAVSGCASLCSAYIWAHDSVENGLVMPEVMMAMHDLLDWRSDAAAGNHENGVSAIYGLGQTDDPYHVYLEAMLHRAKCHPLSGAYAMAGIVYLHFTSVRYGSYDLDGDIWEPCNECECLLREITVGAGFQWAPAPPPSSFTAGEYFRHLGKRLVDRFERLPLAQYGMSWLQHLIISGQIRAFDALIKIGSIDSAVGWV